MPLPNIYSKNKRILGNVNFNKNMQRKELFPVKKEQPSYEIDRSFSQVKKTLVNMNIRPFKELYHT
jgi:hypothetical protein